MMRHREEPEFKTIEILRLQVIARALENEAMMRYVSNPENHEAIGDAMRMALEKMKELEGSRRCPMFWHHIPSCACEPDEFLPLPNSQPKELTQQLINDLDRVATQVDALYRRLGKLPPGER